MNSEKSFRCLACGSTSKMHLCSKNGFDYDACVWCGHAQSTYTPGTEDLQHCRSRTGSHHTSSAKLQWDYSPFKERTVFAPRLAMLSRLTEQGHLLDIGCSNGAFLHAAGKAGWTVKGLELNRESAAVARGHGIEVHEATLEQAALASESVSVVTLWQVLEHLHDPRQTLVEINRVLRPGGILALSTPNIKSLGWHLLHNRWPATEPEGHYHLFSAGSVRRFLLHMGFHIESIQTLDFLPATVKALFSRKKVATQNATASLATSGKKRSLPLLLASRPFVNIFMRLTGLGDDLYCYARKVTPGS